MEYYYDPSLAVEASFLHPLAWSAAACVGWQIVSANTAAVRAVHAARQNKKKGV